MREQINGKVNQCHTMMQCWMRQTSVCGHHMTLSVYVLVLPLSRPIYCCTLVPSNSASIKSQSVIQIYNATHNDAYAVESC